MVEKIGETEEGKNYRQFKIKRVEEKGNFIHIFFDLTGIIVTIPRRRIKLEIIYDLKEGDIVEIKGKKGNTDDELNKSPIINLKYNGENVLNDFNNIDWTQRSVIELAGNDALTIKNLILLIVDKITDLDSKGIFISENEKDDLLIKLSEFVSEDNLLVKYRSIIEGFLEAIYSNKLYAVNKEPYIATYGNMSYCDGKFPNPLSMYDREEYKYINKVLMGEGASLKFNLGKMVNLGRQIVKVGDQSEETCKNIAPVSCVDGNVDLEYLSTAYPNLKGFFDNSEICPIDAWECPYEDDRCNQPDMYRFNNDTIVAYASGNDTIIEMRNRKGNKIIKSNVISQVNNIVDVEDLGNDWFNFTFNFNGQTISRLVYFNSEIGFDWDGATSYGVGGDGGGGGGGTVSGFSSYSAGNTTYQTYVHGGTAYSRKGTVGLNGSITYEEPKQITPEGYNCRLPKLIDVNTKTYVVVYEKGGVTYVGGFRDEGDEVVELTSYQIGDGTDYNIEQLTEDILAVVYKASAHMETFRLQGTKPDLTDKLDEYESNKENIKNVFGHKVGSVYYAMIMGVGTGTEIEITKVNKTDGKISLIKEYNDIPCDLVDVKKNGGNFSLICKHGIHELNILPPTDEETMNMINKLSGGEDELSDQQGGAQQSGDPEPVCGNGSVEGTEQCDDGNEINDDSCTNECKIHISNPEEDFVDFGFSFDDGSSRPIYPKNCKDIIDRGAYFSNYDLVGEYEGQNISINYDGTTGSIMSGTYWIDPDGEVDYMIDGSTVLFIQSNTVGGSANIKDLAKNKTITKYGGVSHINSEDTLGRSSLYFDGNGQGLSIGDSLDWNIGDGPFSIDFWINTTQTTTGTIIRHYPIDNGNGWYININDNGNGVYAFLGNSGSSKNMQLSSQINDGIWHHIALIHDGDSIILLIDGKKMLSKPILFSMGDVSGDLIIGKSLDGFADFQGYLDNIRITKGEALWIGNFTPPVEAIKTYCDMSTDGGGWTMIMNGDMTDNSSISEGSEYSGKPYLNKDFNIGKTSYKNMVENLGSDTVQIAVSGKDRYDGWKMKREIGGFYTGSLNTSEVGGLKSSCTSSIIKENNISYSLNNLVKLEKIKRAGNRCHESSTNAYYQFGGINAHRRYYNFSGLYNDGVWNSADNTVRFR